MGTKTESDMDVGEMLDQLVEVGLEIVKALKENKPLPVKLDIPRASVNVTTPAASPPTVHVAAPNVTVQASPAPNVKIDHPSWGSIEIEVTERDINSRLKKMTIRKIK